MSVPFVGKTSDALCPNAGSTREVWRMLFHKFMMGAGYSESGCFRYLNYDSTRFMVLRRGMFKGLRRSIESGVIVSFRDRRLT